MSIVLASGSPRRKELLEMLGIEDMKIIPAKGEEIPPEGAGPAELVVALATAKGREVAAQCAADDVIIAADTIVWHDGRVFGKPHSREQAATMLRSLSGRAHEVYTGVIVIKNGREVSGAERSVVHFRELSEDEIQRYIDTGEPMDKAGAVRARHRGRLLQRHGSAAVPSRRNAEGTGSGSALKEYLKKNGIRIGIIVAAAALIIGLGSAARNGKISLSQNAFGIFKSPIQKAMSSTVNWFNTIYGYLFDYDSLLADNESLRTQLAEAQQAARDGISASEENVRLREALNLRAKHTDYELESSKVVLWSSSNWSSSFTISKGASSGIEYGDPVITEYGALVGQVTELGETWATVSTLIDVDMSVGAFVGDTGTSGMVMGEFALMKNKQAKLTFLADGAQIFVGDEVLTSGQGGAFPQGLVIGTITAVQTEAGGQIEFGLVQPQCNFESLVQVFVIKSFEVVE